MVQLTGRFAALVGVSAAAATAALVAVAAPAFAADSRQTTCTEQVRVRSQPSATAPVIGSCKAGEAITVSQSQNGFTRAVNKQGWISSDYVSGERTATHSDTSPGGGSDANGASTGPDDHHSNSDSTDSSDGNNSDSNNSDGNSDNGDNGDDHGGNNDSGSDSGLFGGGLL